MSVDDVSLEVPSGISLRDALTSDVNRDSLPYPDAKTVSGVQGTITDVNVNVTGFFHTFPNDVRHAARRPAGGQKVMLMSDVGGGSLGTLLGAQVIFDDEAAGSVPSPLNATGGTFKPTDFDPAEMQVCSADAQPSIPAGTQSFDPRRVRRHRPERGLAAVRHR